MFTYAARGDPGQSARERRPPTLSIGNVFYWGWRRARHPPWDMSPWEEGAAAGWSDQPEVSNLPGNRPGDDFGCERAEPDGA